MWRCMQRELDCNQIKKKTMEFLLTDYILISFFPLQRPNAEILHFVKHNFLPSAGSNRPLSCHVRRSCYNITKERRPEFDTSKDTGVTHTHTHTHTLLLLLLLLLLLCHSPLPLLFHTKTTVSTHILKNIGWRMDHYILTKTFDK